ncbi:MAG: VWA domain-containing protein, partial [bacterium]|nr:VWA domain-containing protein [bacterium]
MRSVWLAALCAILLWTVALAQGQPTSPPPPAGQQGNSPRNPQQTAQPDQDDQGAQGADHPEDPYLKYADARVRVTQIETAEFPTVRAFVAVTDQNGALIKTLKEGDFTAEENKTGVTGLRFANRSELNLPLAIMFVVDVSGSMQPAIEQEKEAIRQFVDKLKPEDRVGLVTFSDAAITQVRLTTDRAELLRAVDELMPQYQTALWDGIYTGLQELLADAEPGRKAMIVMSDGVDNRSVENTGTIMQAYNDQARAQNKGFSIFTLGLGLDLDRQGLENIADQTSGLYIESPTPDDLSSVYESILSQIQGEYLLEYESPVESADGQIIDLEVGVLPVKTDEPGKYTYRSP